MWGHGGAHTLWRNNTLDIGDTLGWRWYTLAQTQNLSPLDLGDTSECGVLHRSGGTPGCGMPL